MKRVLFFLLFVCLFQFSKAQSDESSNQQIWISVEYIKQMESLLPCQCAEKENFIYKIVVDQNKTNNFDENKQFIPNGILHFVIQTEPIPFYFLSNQKNTYVISIDSESPAADLIFTEDTLTFNDFQDTYKFIKYQSLFNTEKGTTPPLEENIFLINKALQSRGYPNIETLLNQNSLNLVCNAWQGTVNFLSSNNSNEQWVLEINEDLLYIYRIKNLERDPTDPLLTEIYLILKWNPNADPNYFDKKFETTIWIDDNIEIQTE